MNYMMVKCGNCFATYHLGMILAIIQVGPIRNRSGLIGMPDLHASQYTVFCVSIFSRNESDSTLEASYEFYEMAYLSSFAVFFVTWCSPEPWDPNLFITFPVSGWSRYTLEPLLSTTSKLPSPYKKHIQTCSALPMKGRGGWFTHFLQKSKRKIL